MQLQLICSGFVAVLTMRMQWICSGLAVDVHLICTCNVLAIICSELAVGRQRIGCGFAVAVNLQLIGTGNEFASSLLWNCC